MLWPKGTGTLLGAEGEGDVKNSLHPYIKKINRYTLHQHPTSTLPLQCPPKEEPAIITRTANNCTVLIAPVIVQSAYKYQLILSHNNSVVPEWWSLPFYRWANLDIYKSSKKQLEVSWWVSGRGMDSSEQGSWEETGWRGALIIPHLGEELE